MKKNILLFPVILLSLITFAQNPTTTKEQLPSRNFSLSRAEVANIQLAPPSQTKIDELVADNSGFYAVATHLPIDFTAVNSGTVDNLTNGGKLWRMQISSAGSLSCVLLFDYFNLPAGAEMYVHCENTKTVFGPYRHEDNPSGQSYAIGVIPDDELSIEYYVPNGTDFSESDFKISYFDYFFRAGEQGDLEIDTRAGFGESSACEINVNCSEGANWQSQKKGVCRIYLVIPGVGAGYCSGSLIGNTSHNGTPYILSAQHCEGSYTVNYAQSIFLFNYEATGCSNPSTSPTGGTSFTGATRISGGSINGGTDFLLMQLTNASTTAIKNANLVYNGWDRTNVLTSAAASNNGASIHHPAGDIKKISLYTERLYIYTWPGTSSNPISGASNGHWLLEFSSGLTEGGSSGSPLFSGENKVIIGTLTGGSSACNNNVVSGVELYGRFDRHWKNTANGSGYSYELEHWLDPNSTGAIICPMYDPNQPLVTGVVVSPATVSVQKGNSRQFVATVNGINNPPQTVNWTVTGGISGTTISTSGLLSVAANETATTLTVRATSTLNTAISGTSAISIPAEPAVAALPFSDNFENNSEWVLINGNQTNHWVISSGPDNCITTAHNLYITDNDDAPNCPAYHYTDNSTSRVYATKTLNFTETGYYGISYAWRCAGEVFDGTNYDFARIWLAPASVTLTAGTIPASSTWIDLTGGIDLNQQPGWIDKVLLFYISTTGNYKLIIYWENDNSYGTQPPFAIDNILLARVPPTVTSVDVSPASTSVVKGETQAFSASVTGTNNPPQTVTWEVIGGIPGTSISTDGLLTVSANETATTLTVRATSTLDYTKYGEAIITVTISPVSVPFTENFENNPNWILVNGSQTNHWVISTAPEAQATGSTKSLYISKDNATPPSYGYDTTATSYVYAYKPLNFSNTGNYQIAFDWKSHGENNYDVLRCFLVPNDIILTAGDANGMTASNNITPADWIDLASGIVLSWNNTWQSVNKSLDIAAGTYKLVFFWKNDYMDGNQTPAAVDNISITANIPPVITTTTLPDGTYNAEYTTTLTATGTAPIWTLQAGSNLPTGLSISTAGIISGTPMQTGTFDFTVVATNSAGNDTKALSIVVNLPPAIVTDVIVSPATAIVQQGDEQLFSATVIGTNDPPQTVEWTVSGGGAGTNISTDGLLTVAANELATALTVKATSTYDNTKFGEASVTVIPSTAISDIDDSEIVIYPNPVKTELRIKNYELRDGETIEIYDISGKLQFSTTLHNLAQFGTRKIDVSNLPQGVYLLRVGNNVAKFIKE